MSPHAAADLDTAATDGYTPRIADAELDELLETAPAIAIEGALGVGKTATARRRAETVHALEDAEQLSAARAWPGRLCEGPSPVLIDEWMHVPQAWHLVRRAAAGGIQAGRFLLASSTMPVWLAEEVGGIEVPSLRMRPLALAERCLDTPSVSLRELLEGARGSVVGTTNLGFADYVHEIVVSGLPGLHGLSETQARAQLRDYLERLVDRELPARGLLVHDPEALRLWLTAYAAATSLTVSFEAIHDAAGGGRRERRLLSLANAFRITLERLWIVDPLEPWAPAQVGSGSIRMEPKHQPADPAFAALLLGVDAERLLTPSSGRRGRSSETRRDETLPAALFESLVTLSVRVYAQAVGAQVSHLCGSVDWPDVELIVEGEDERVVAIAVATDQEAEDRRARALLRTAQLLEHTLADAVVITAGREARRREDGVATVPAVLLGP